jgi:hypothetical protein
MSPRTRGFALIALAFALSAVFLGCGRTRGGAAGGAVDTAALSRPGGDVLLDEGGRIPYEITSDRYREWEAARRALRAAKISLTMRLDPLHVAQSDIDRAVNFFEGNGRARRAIEGAGISVRDYVLTTIALEQQMAVANGKWGAREQPATPATPVVPRESISAELSRDSSREETTRVRVDTVQRVDTVVVPRRDTVPPDTTAQH